MHASPKATRPRLSQTRVERAVSAPIGRALFSGVGCQIATASTNLQLLPGGKPRVDSDLAKVFCLRRHRAGRYIPERVHIANVSGDALQYRAHVGDVLRPE